MVAAEAAGGTYDEGRTLDAVQEIARSMAVVINTSTAQEIDEAGDDPDALRAAFSGRAEQLADMLAGSLTEFAEHEAAVQNDLEEVR